MKPNFFKTSSNELNKAFTISIVIHLLIGIVLAFFSCFSGQEDLDEFELFTEIDFVYKSSSRMISTGEVKPDNASEFQQPSVGTETKEDEIIDLPKRRMLEEALPELPIPNEKKLQLEPENQIIPIKKQALVSNDTTQNHFLPMMEEEKDVADATVAPLTDHEIYAGKISSDSGKVDPRFFIEGEAASRKVLSKVIPNYPEGLGRQEVIKIRFTVLPDGLVGEVIPLIKGTPQLERISLEAFKQWRFNPLPENEPPKIVTGEITFRYLLK